MEKRKKGSRGEGGKTKKKTGGGRNEKGARKEEGMKEGKLKRKRKGRYTKTPSMIKGFLRR